MIRGKYGQARCPDCQGWHFAIQLDDNLNPEEFKCCRCKKIYKFKPKLQTLNSQIETTSKKEKSSTAFIGGNSKNKATYAGSTNTR
jgi:hypothetical protein